ncbi:MAG: hypothetical protein ACO273_13680, partial [Burkholderiales bacterium]
MMSSLSGDSFSKNSEEIRDCVLRCLLLMGRIITQSDEKGEYLYSSVYKATYITNSLIISITYLLATAVG